MIKLEVSEGWKCEYVFSTAWFDKSKPAVITFTQDTLEKNRYKCPDTASFTVTVDGSTWHVCRAHLNVCRRADKHNESLKV